MGIGSGTNFSQTPAMFLRLPTPGVCGPLGVEPPGLSWLELVNASLGQIDGHTHAAGYGMPIPSAGLNINADLPFGSNNATALRSVRFNPIGLTSLGAADLSSLFVSGGDLYFIDSQANQVRLTAAGGVAGTPGSISGLAGPAGVTYNATSKLFTFTSASGFAAALSAGPLSISDASVANGKAVTIGVPAALGANYALTLPATLPASGTKFLTVTSTGAIGDAFDVDNTTLQISSNLISVRILTPTAIIPVAGYSVFNNAAYWKDVLGHVHMKGGALVTSAIGSTTAILFNLPAGFRPADQRVFAVGQTGESGPVLERQISVAANGDVRVTGYGTSAAASGFLDDVVFLAEA